MKWILLDLAIALAALGLLAFLVLGLWRKVKALSGAVARAGETVATATEQLAAVQAQGPLGDPSRSRPGQAPDASRTGPQA